MDLTSRDAVNCAHSERSGSLETVNGNMLLLCRRAARNDCPRAYCYALIPRSFIAFPPSMATLSDEADTAHGRVAFTAPIARAILGREVGETAAFNTPRGQDLLQVVSIAYGAE